MQFFLQSSLFREYFQINSYEEIQFFQLVPLAPDKFEQAEHVAISFKNSELNLLNLESLLQENRNLKIQLDKSKETIMALSGEYSKNFMKSSKSNNNAKKIKPVVKSRKVKQLEDENKNLQKLLDQQIEESENLRLETQQTVERLRLEFELFVKGLNSTSQPDASIIQVTSLNDPKGLNASLTLSQNGKRVDIQEASLESNKRVAFNHK